MRKEVISYHYNEPHGEISNLLRQQILFYTNKLQLKNSLNFTYDSIKILNVHTNSSLIEVFFEFI